MAMKYESDQSASPDIAVRRRLYRIWWFRLIVGTLVAYVIWCAMLYEYQDALVFPVRMISPPLREVPPGAIVSAIDIGDGERNLAWFFPAPQVSAGTPAPAVVFFHGNAELIDMQDPIVRGYHRMGVSVLLPEYRGYGRAGGSPSQEGIVSDSVRFVDQLITRADVDPARIAFHGRSLGGGVAAQVAAQRKPSALILEVTFTSIASMSSQYGVPSFLVRHPFRTDAVIGEIGSPVLIFGGTRDTIVPVEHSRTLRALRPDATYIEYDSDHNGFPGDAHENDYWHQIQLFLSGTSVLRYPR